MRLKEEKHYYILKIYIAHLVQETHIKLVMLWGKKQTQLLFPDGFCFHVLVSSKVLRIEDSYAYWQVFIA